MVRAPSPFRGRGWAQARLFAAADLSTDLSAEALAKGEALAKVEIPTTTNQAAAWRAVAPIRGNRAEAWTQGSLFALVETPVQAKPAAPRRAVEGAVQLRLF
jgi:hypothetical protein